MRNLKKVRLSYRFMELIIGMIYIILSLIAMRDVKVEFAITIQLFGIFSIMKGVFELLNYTNIKKRINVLSESVLVIGGIDILLGINLLFFYKLNIAMLSIIFGLWFLLNTLLNMCTSLILKSMSKKLWIIVMAVYYFCIVIAVLLIFRINILDWSISSEIGTYFLIFGSIKIISGVINKNDIHTI
ncbi:DUF308 domain-containing protein [Lactiplantibacillus plantarum]|uniref:DUF308 domain-containing protein n=1 Tax=Lactiplantibacillus plantarum TaxID=1590 RepID=UPI001BACD73F|nr:DUF308 domain-containing protein [Lactiplantibacillus plantarum]MBS0946009.1 DUF308 domain-containing protein [Lactiplantibacillus plantarum]